jgi:hypothetical protein
MSAQRKQKTLGKGLRSPEIFPGIPTFLAVHNTEIPIFPPGFISTYGGKTGHQIARVTITTIFSVF